MRDELEYLRIGTTIVYILHAIMVLRVHGIYGSRPLLYTLCALLPISLGIELYIVLTFAPKYIEADLGPVIGRVCVPEDARKAPLIW